MAWNVNEILLRFSLIFHTHTHTHTRSQHSPAIFVLIFLVVCTVIYFCCCLHFLWQKKLKRRPFPLRNCPLYDRDNTQRQREREREEICLLDCLRQNVFCGCRQPWGMSSVRNNNNNNACNEPSSRQLWQEAAASAASAVLQLRAAKKKDIRYAEMKLKTFRNYVCFFFSSTPWNMPWYCWGKTWCIQSVWEQCQCEADLEGVFIWDYVG